MGRQQHNTCSGYQRNGTSRKSLAQHRHFNGVPVVIWRQAPLRLKLMQQQPKVVPV